MDEEFGTAQQPTSAAAAISANPGEVGQSQQTRPRSEGRKSIGPEDDQSRCGATTKGHQ